MLPLAWVMVLLDFRVGLSLYVILKHAEWELEGPPKTTAFFQRWRPWTRMDKLVGTYLPQGQAPRFPPDRLQISSSPRYPSTMIEWTIGGRVHIHILIGEDLSIPSAPNVPKNRPMERILVCRRWFQAGWQLFAAPTGVSTVEPV